MGSNPGADLSQQHPLYIGRGLFLRGYGNLFWKHFSDIQGGEANFAGRVFIE